MPLAGMQSPHCRANEAAAQTCCAARGRHSSRRQSLPHRCMMQAHTQLTLHSFVVVVLQAILVAYHLAIQLVYQFIHSGVQV